MHDSVYTRVARRRGRDAGPCNMHVRDGRWSCTGRCGMGARDVLGVACRSGRAGGLVAHVLMCLARRMAWLGHDLPKQPPFYFYFF